MTTALQVVMDGHVIGNVIPRGDGGRLLYSDKAQVPLSCSMPLSRPRHRADVLLPWLRNLLPDNGSVLMQWRQAFGVRTSNPIDLLAHVGEEVAGGAQFVRDDRLDAAMTWKPARPVTETEVGDMLRRALAAVPEADLATATGRFSLAGMQPKIALQRLDDGAWALPEGINPTTHILKPAMPGLADQHINECLTMTAAARAGLDVAPAEVAVIDGIPVIIVERFDRVRTGDRWTRAHQEDLLQALGLPPELKYQNQGGPGARTIATLLREVTGGGESVWAFVSSLVFHWLTVSTDAHAKNYSLLLGANGRRLAPLYDLNSYLYYGAGAAREMSIRIGAEYRSDQIGRSDWASLARDCGVDDEALMAEIRRQAGILPDAFSDAARGLPRSTLTDRLTDEVAAWTAVAAGRVGC